MNWWQEWKWFYKQSQKIGRFQFKEWNPNCTYLTIANTNFHKEIYIRRTWIEKL